MLASGEGTNLQALLDRVHGETASEWSRWPPTSREARALERARERRGADQRRSAIGDFQQPCGTRDGAIADWLLSTRRTELVVLAGYMQLLSPGFLAAFPNGVINVHPALLPAFPGLNAVQQALDYGVKVFGVTVHFVDDGVDTGPVILQRAIELPDARRARGRAPSACTRSSTSCFPRRCG